MAVKLPHPKGNLDSSKLAYAVYEGAKGMGISYAECEYVVIDWINGRVEFGNGYTKNHINAANVLKNLGPDYGRYLVDAPKTKEQTTEEKQRKLLNDLGLHGTFGQSFLDFFKRD